MMAAWRDGTPRVWYSANTESVIASKYEMSVPPCLGPMLIAMSDIVNDEAWRPMRSPASTQVPMTSPGSGLTWKIVTLSAGRSRGRSET